jgi:hypothetical protein
MDARYQLFPKVVAPEPETALEIESLNPDAAYLVSGLPLRARRQIWTRELRTDSEGRLRWTERFPFTGEYLLDIYAQGARRAVATAHLYAAPPDLARRLPLRCDFHIHTYYSDGHQSPVEMAVRGRELGLDALAITDHNRHLPSKEAVAGVEQLGLNLICLPGEEVSFPDWHMLAVSTRAAVWERYNSDEGTAEIAALEAALADKKLAGGLTAAEYAPIRWAVESIHRHGGRAFLAHPYWISERGRHLDIRFYEQLVAEGVLDGVELIGDVDYEDNLLSVAHYQGLLEKGYRLPILGNSDTHDAAHTFGGHWSIAFVEEMSSAGLLQAIQKRYSVACTLITPAKQRDALRVYGPVEMVEYALFLSREFYPLHLRICEEEARHASAALLGDETAKQGLAACRDQMATLYRRSFLAKS